MGENDKEERIGDFMVRIGAITAAQVAEILAKQKQEPEKLFGVIAVELGYLNDKAIHDYIAAQEAKEKSK
jgi:hypothetical protein